MPELKPCPFCGNEVVVIRRYNLSNKPFVICFDCMTHGPEGKSKKAAIAAWNKRVKEGEE